MDTLLYVLKDGLLRLTNVRKLQCAKKCGTYFITLAVFLFLEEGGGGGGELLGGLVDVFRLLGRQTFSYVPVHYYSPAEILSNHKTDT